MNEEEELNQDKDDGKFEEWMYEFAWKLLDEAYDSIKTLDNKAMNIVNISSVLIPIITGVLFFVSDKNQSSASINLPFIYSLGFLLLTIVSALLAIWLRDVKTISLFKHFKECSDSEIIVIKGRTSKTIARWQEHMIKIRNEKALFLRISSILFFSALISLTWGTYKLRILF